MTIFGWDMSHYDAPGMGSAIGDGIQFVTHKAGGDANDAELALWWRDAKGQRSRALLGAYWVLYPGRPEARADAFLDRLDSQCAGWRDGPFILQVDCEKWGGNASTVPDREDIQAFCDRLREKCPKLMPIVYAPKWVYGDTLRGMNYPIWASSYVNGAGGFKTLYPGDGSVRWGSYSGQVPEVLQYTSSATIGGQTTCDANAYRGTLKELTALLAPGWVKEEVEDMALDGNDKKFITDTIAAAVKPLTTQTAFPTGGGQHSPIGDAFLNGSYPRAAGAQRTYVWSNLQDIHAKLSTILAAVGKDNVDEAAIVAGVLAGISPEAIAAAIPEDVAQQIVNILTARLAE